MKRILFSILTFLVFLSCSCNKEVSVLTENCADTAKLKKHLIQITQTEESRNYINVETLNQVAEYLYQELKKVCDTVFYQEYDFEGTIYKNVIGKMGDTQKKRFVVGAHYDVAGNQQGADDNASGVAGLLELARLISLDTLNADFEFVAYTLEEPPFFKTEHMGSYIHAKSLADQNIEIEGMICLEMIGYFSDEKNSQQYPAGILKPFYGSKGNFITVVQKYGNGKFGRKMKKLMKEQQLIPTKSFTAPADLPGIDFSDHLNYWKFDFSAVMITNTAFYRNENYHEPTDTLETLDIERMSKVIDQLFFSLRNY